jgi:hypothetical protein
MARHIAEASLSFTPTRKPRSPKRGFHFVALHQRYSPAANDEARPKALVLISPPIGAAITCAKQFQE